MIGTEPLKKLIQEHARVAQLFAQALEDGMLTLKMDGLEKALQGVTDLKQVRAVCIKKGITPRGGGYRWLDFHRFKFDIAMDAPATCFAASNSSTRSVLRSPRNATSTACWRPS
jgi:hypothetical protein